MHHGKQQYEESLGPEAELVWYKRNIADQGHPEEELYVRSRRGGKER